MSETAAPSTKNIVGHPISHISYGVQDLTTAVDLWVAAFGAGPFFLLEHIKLRSRRSRRRASGLGPLGGVWPVGTDRCGTAADS